MSALSRTLTLGGYFGLLAILMLWPTWLSPPQRLPVALVLILLIPPLLFPLRGLLAGKIYTHAWTGFLALGYFLVGAVEGFANPAARLPALVTAGASLVLFAGSQLFVRSRSRERRSREDRSSPRARRG
jgi:uncharacterized membrane protein